MGRNWGKSHRSYLIEKWKVYLGIGEYSSLDKATREEFGWNYKASDNHLKKIWEDSKKTEDMGEADAIEMWPKKFSENPFYPDQIQVLKNFRSNWKKTLNSSEWQVELDTHKHAENNAGTELEEVDTEEADATFDDVATDDIFATDDNFATEETVHHASVHASNGSPGSFISHSMQASYQVVGGVSGVKERISVLSSPISGWYESKSSSEPVLLSADGSTLSFTYPYDKRFLDPSSFMKYYQGPSTMPQTRVNQLRTELKHMYNESSPAMVAFSAEVEKLGLIDHLNPPHFTVEVPLIKNCEAIIPLTPSAHPCAQVR